MTKYRKLQRRVPKSPICKIDGCGKPKLAGKSSLCAEHHSEKNTKYQHDWYLNNKDKAKEYQRRYGLDHKKKQRNPTAAGMTAKRPKKRTYKLSDIQGLDPMKIVGKWERILA